MSSYVLCRCPAGHAPHQFTAGAFGLCAHCSHGVGAHRSSQRESAEVADRLIRLPRTHEIEEFAVTGFDADGGLEVHLSLRKPKPVSP